MFIFHISLDKAENFNERDKTLKDLKIPRIADTIPVMYLVRISPDGDQTQKISIVIKKLEKDLKKLQSSRSYYSSYKTSVF